MRTFFEEKVKKNDTTMITFLMYNKLGYKGKINDDKRKFKNIKILIIN